MLESDSDSADIIKEENFDDSTKKSDESKDIKLPIVDKMEPSLKKQNIQNE